MIPSLFERDVLRYNLVQELTAQAEGLPVELLVLLDNRVQSTGRKRQALLDLAAGDFVTCLDDDDFVSADYVSTILEQARLVPNADVIAFNSEATLDSGNPFVVRASIMFENEQARQEVGRWVDIRRKPWHWCAWSRRLAKHAVFPDTCVDDDWAWVRQMLPTVQVEARVDRVLHHYRYSSGASRSNRGDSTTVS